MRDVLKQAENGRKQITYTRDISVGELNQLHQLALDPPNIHTLNACMTQS